MLDPGPNSDSMNPDPQHMSEETGFRLFKTCYGTWNDHISLSNASIDGKLTLRNNLVLQRLSLVYSISFLVW